VADAHPKCDAWACDACGSVVFVPQSAEIKGGVCTQQAHGCNGSIALLDEQTAALARARLARIGLRERPWLTLVFVPFAGNVAVGGAAPPEGG